jgi:hypothetical protein
LVHSPKRDSDLETAYIQSLNFRGGCPEVSAVKREVLFGVEGFTPGICMEKHVEAQKFCLTSAVARDKISPHEFGIVIRAPGWWSGDYLTDGRRLFWGDVMEASLCGATSKQSCVQRYDGMMLFMESSQFIMVFSITEHASPLLLVIHFEAYPRLLLSLSTNPLHVSVRSC